MNLTSSLSTHALEGGCLCAAVRYRLSGAPLVSSVCHCQSCRKASASPSVAWLTVDRSAFQLLGGTLRRFASSPGVVRSFCGHCGSPLTCESEAEPEVLDITTASLDEPARCPPTREVWLEHRVDWQMVNPDLALYARSRAEGHLPAG